MRSTLQQKLRYYWDRLTLPSPSLKNEQQIQEARLAASLSLAMIPVAVVVIILWQLTDPNFPAAPFLAIGILVSLSIVYGLSRSSRSTIAPHVYIGMMLVLVVVFILTVPGPIEERMLTLNFLNIAILLASFMMSVRHTLVVAILSLGGTAVFAFIADISLTTTFSYLVFMVIMAGFLILAKLIRARDIRHLHESQRRYQALFNQSNDGVFIIDLAGNYLEVNQSAADMLGYTLEETTELSFRDIIPPGEIELSEKVLKQLLNNEHLPIYERNLLRKDGSMFPVEINVELVSDNQGRPMHIQSNVRDITERKEVENQLRKQEEYLRILIEQTPIGIVTIDLEGNFTDVNPRALEILGSPESTLKTNANVLRISSLAELGISQMIEAAMTGGQMEEMETWYTSSWGKTVYLLLRAVPHFDGLGNQIGLIVLVEDLTERVKAEEGMRQMQKLDSLSVLAGGIAHDFNNLLVAMLGQTSLAVAKLRPESPGRPHVEKAVSAANRAARLTQQLLAYSGRGHFQVAHLNLNALIEENLHLFEATIPKHIHLKTTLAQDLPTVEVDLAQMQQLVMNLIINASEALGERRGTISIVTDVQTLAGETYKYWQFTMKPLQDDLYVTLEVHDDGVGMTKETLANIFDPFFTTKEQGHGLGLAAVLGIIKSHHGGLAVYSEPGKGSTFKIFLPASVQPLEEIEETIQTQSEPIGGLVLVIDDEKFVRLAVADILSMDNIEVISAEDGKEGLALFKERQSEIALVLLDLSMPGWSGDETMRELQKVDPAVSIILSSGYNEVEATRLFIGKGLVGFLQKPYSTDVLLDTVRKYIKG